MQAQGLNTGLSLGTNETFTVTELGVGRVTGDHLEQERAEPKHVHRRGWWRLTSLLGAHVTDGPRDIEGPGESTRHSRLQRPGIEPGRVTEVEQFDLAGVLVDHKDIGRRDVAVDDPPFVAGDQAVRDLAPDIDDRVDREPALDEQPVQGPPWEHLRGEPRPISIFEAPAGDELDDVRRALELPEVARLVDQPLLSLRATHVARLEYFESNLSPRRVVAGTIDEAHAALAELREQLEAISAESSAGRGPLRRVHCPPPWRVVVDKVPFPSLTSKYLRPSSASTRRVPARVQGLSEEGRQDTLWVPGRSLAVATQSSS